VPDAASPTTQLKQEIHQELTGNILPFWAIHTIDRQNGGFHGALTNDLQMHNEVPRSAVLCARILWTYSAACRILGDEKYLDTARWAYDYLTRVFWDHEHGGLYWQVDVNGKPVMDRKHHYAQSFGIYGLTEYYRVTNDARSLILSERLFELLEAHAHEPRFGGYTEGSSRAWGMLDDMRLSPKDMNCRKSMNTMLHVMEGYTNLLRVWDDPRLKRQHRALIEIFLEHILDPHSGHLKLFFDDDWTSLADIDSYGHDIEASWLLCEAAELHHDPQLTDRVRAASLRLAEATLRDGLDSDGSLLYESNGRGHTDTDREWWAQAEAMVGFYNAWQLSGEARFAQAASGIWTYIRDHMVDHENGDWFKRVRRDGTPRTDVYKAGPWECPYHHSRACFEMLERIK
jgi:mannobiose 2-epimerase